MEKEDYDLAKEKKQQMERFRTQVYEQLALHSLADPELVGARAGPQRGSRRPQSSWRADFVKRTCVMLRGHSWQVT